MFKLHAMNLPWNFNQSYRVNPSEYLRTRFGTLIQNVFPSGHQYLLSCELETNDLRCPQRKNPMKWDPEIFLGLYSRHFLHLIKIGRNLYIFQTSMNSDFWDTLVFVIICDEEIKSEWYTSERADWSHTDSFLRLLVGFRAPQLHLFFWYFPG